MSYDDRFYGPPRLAEWGLRAIVAVVIAAIGIASLAVKGCQRGPFGRRQVVALNTQQEAALGAQAYREVLSKSEVLRSGPIVTAVNAVFERLKDAAGNQQFLNATGLKYQPMDWECRVVQSREVNAFCLPGGKIVVYTAILPVCKTDAGLATVMGHEIGHALAHHGAERMARQQMANIAVGAAGTSMGDMDPRQRAQVMQILNAGAQFGILKYSRDQESEADHIGLLLMATAGYDPRQAIDFWKRMEESAAKSGGRHPPEFMSTHPSHGTRMRALEGWMSQALALYEASGRTTPPQMLPLR
jgi:predicted Zn-dependent protease